MKWSVGSKVAVWSMGKFDFVGTVTDVRPYPCSEYWWGYTVDGVRTVGCFLREPKA